jgi:hypothetical protein
VALLVFRYATLFGEAPGGVDNATEDIFAFVMGQPQTPQE